MVLLISYELNGHERPSAYDDVAESIEKAALSFRRPLYSQWLVETRKSVDWWCERLQTVIDDDDGLLIVEVHEPNGGRLPSPVWKWLESRTE